MVDTVRADAGASGHTAMFVAVTLLWGLNWPAMKLAVHGFEPWTFRSIVLVFGALTLFAIARALGQSIALPRRLWPAILLPAATVTGWHMFSAFGLLHLGGGRAVIIAFTMPLWAALLATWWLHERLEPRRLIALVAGLAGLGLLLVDDLASVQAAPVGLLLMLAAALSWAVGTVAIKSVDWGTSAIVLTAWQLALGAVPIVGFWLWQGAKLDLTSPDAGAWFALAYTTFVAMVFCYCAHVYLVTVLPATVAAIGIMAMPLVGLLGSAWLLGEPVGVPELLALAFVVGGQAVLFLAPGR